MDSRRPDTDTNKPSDTIGDGPATTASPGWWRPEWSGFIALAILLIAIGGIGYRLISSVDEDVERLSDRIDRVSERIDRVSERVEEVDDKVDQVAADVSYIRGRLEGNASSIPVNNTPVAGK